MRMFAILILAGCLAGCGPSKPTRLVPAVEHAELAREHGDTEASHVLFRQACGTKPIGEVRVSPLLRFRTGSANTPTGTIVRLSRLAGTPPDVLAAIRCHRAWLMLVEHEAGPFDVPSLQIDAQAEGDSGTAIVLTVDPAHVVELQGRLERQVTTVTAKHHDGE